jgi:hypothetical protein
MAPGTVQATVAVDTWTSLVRGGLGCAGLVLVAASPLAPTAAVAHLPAYTAALGTLLVLVAATMRLRPLLVVLGCLGLSAALALTLLGGPDLGLSAVLLYAAAALLLGAAVRQPWMAIPFLLVPLLIVAPTGSGWGESRDAFTSAWDDAVGCPCPLAGVPAALAVLGAAVGQLSSGPLPQVRPSAGPLLAAAVVLSASAFVAGSLVSGGLATAGLRLGVVAAAVAWVAFTYQAGRTALVWQSALACLLALLGALAVDAGTDSAHLLSLAMAATLLASLLPATLAALGLGLRRWKGRERPQAGSPAA